MLGKTVSVIVAVEGAGLNWQTALAAQEPIAVGPFAMVTVMFWTAILILLKLVLVGMLSTVKTRESVVKRLKSAGKGLGDKVNVWAVPDASFSVKLLIFAEKAKTVKAVGFVSGSAISVTVSGLVPVPLPPPFPPPLPPPFPLPEPDVFGIPLQDARKIAANKAAQRENWLRFIRPPKASESILCRSCKRW